MILLEVIFKYLTAFLPPLGATDFDNYIQNSLQIKGKMITVSCSMPFIMLLPNIIIISPANTFFPPSDVPMFNPRV